MVQGVDSSRGVVCEAMEVVEVDDLVEAVLDGVLKEPIEHLQELITTIVSLRDGHVVVESTCSCLLSTVVIAI